jgi:hypothetical protein
MDKQVNRRTRGQSLVEAALALPILVMLFLGLVDFGRAYYAIVALRDAADEGVTYAATAPHDVLGIRRRATEASPELVPIAPNDVVVTYPPALYSGAPITVTVTTRLELFTPFTNTFVPSGVITLRGHSTHAIIETN